MSRKIVQGLIRDKAKTKEKLLKAVGEILKDKGYTGLLVSKIATVAGCDRKLIYEYFGDTDKLVKEYLRSKKFWKTSGDFVEDISSIDEQKQLIKSTLLNQYDYLRNDIELQKLIIWQLSENRLLLKRIAESKEVSREDLFAKTNVESEKGRAIFAILEAGIIQLSLNESTKASNFCGIDTKSVEGREMIKNALIDFVDLAFTVQQDLSKQVRNQ